MVDCEVNKQFSACRRKHLFLPQHDEPVLACTDTAATLQNGNFQANYGAIQLNFYPQANLHFQHSTESSDIAWKSAFGCREWWILRKHLRKGKDCFTLETLSN